MPIFNFNTDNQRKIFFMGLLANTDSSILNVHLKHDFKVETISEYKVSDLISLFENLPHIEAQWQLLWESGCSNPDEKKCYYITRSFETEDESHTAIFNAINHFNTTFIEGYLDPVIRLIRLFKKGNICMPFKYYYYLNDNIPELCSWGTRNLPVSQERYTLEDSEILELQRFIQNTTLPFQEPFLQLAFDNFELSYQTQNRSLAFLLLIASLEMLFQPSEQDQLADRISRNIAVLLGKNRDKARNIKADVGNLYNKRYRLVHTGNIYVIKKLDVYKLRVYVRESIKEIIKMGKNKKQLLNQLNSCGFGERPWIKSGM